MLSQAVRLVCAVACLLPAAAAAVRVVTFGDSLMAGHDLPAQDGFGPQLQGYLDAHGHDAQVIGLSVSGDTTADGRNRLSEILAATPDVVLLGLGSNDALRRLAPGQAEANLDHIITSLQAAGITVVLLGAQSPLNWGMRYKQDFDAIYPRLVARHGLAFNYAFILEGVALDPRYVLADGLHPNRAGVALMVSGIGPLVEAALAAATAGR